MNPSATGKPSDYPPNQLDPDLTPDTEIIHAAEELLRRMASAT